MKKNISVLLFLIFVYSSNLFAVGTRPPAQQGGQQEQGGGENAPAPAQGGNEPAPAAGNSGGTTSGTIWDHVPAGGSIRAKEDGSWDVLDKNGGVVKNMSQSQAQGNSGSGTTAGQVGTNPVAGGGGGTTLQGNIWDHVPAGGAIRAKEDGTWDVVDKNGNVIKNMTNEEAHGKTGSGSGTSGGSGNQPPAGGGNNQPPAQPPPPPPVQHVDQLPDGSGTVTHTQNPDGTWSHHVERQTSMGPVSFDLKPGDPLYPTGDPLYDPPKPYDPLAPQGDGPFKTPLEPPANGYVESWRDKDGKWHHKLHKETDMGTLDFELKPDSGYWPHGDPRFPTPLPPLHPTTTSGNFGDDVGAGGQLAAADPFARDLLMEGGQNQEQHHDHQEQA